MKIVALHRKMKTINLGSNSRTVSGLYALQTGHFNSYLKPVPLKRGTFTTLTSE
jgi:hypothetical protein